MKSLKEWKQLLYHNADFLSLAILITVIVFTNSLGGDFVSDDIAAFIRNPMTKDMAASLRTLNLQTILYAVVYKYFGFNKYILHTYSLLLHITMIPLIFTFVKTNFTTKTARIATLLFAVHPVVTESVAWISASFYILGGIGIFLTLILYKMYTENKDNRYYLASFSVYLFLQAIAASPQLFVAVPLLIIADQLLFREKINLKEAPKYISFFLASLIPVVTLSKSITPRIETLSKGANYFLRVGYSIYGSIKLLVFPKDLTLYHEGQTISSAVLFWIIITALVLVIYIISLAKVKENRKILGLVLMGIFSIIYVLSPIQISWFIAERYLYIATAIFCTLIAITILDIEKYTRTKNLAITLTIIVTLIYSVRSMVRNSEWQTRKKVWESTARISPNSPRVYNNLGDVYALEGDIEKSIKAFSTAISLNPNYAEANYNLGNTYAQIGDLEKAKEYYTKALELNPNLPKPTFY